MPIRANARQPALQRLLGLVSGSGWPARMAYQLGLQRSVSVVKHDIILADDASTGHRTMRASAMAQPALWKSAASVLRIVFASDFHAGPATHRSLLRDACRAMRQAEPDLLLLGGDFVSFRASNMDSLIKELAEIGAPLGRFAVLGNHDYWSGHQEIVRKLEMADISVLHNANVRLPPPYDGVWLCGMDDHSTGQPEAESAFCGADGFRIVLMHSPSGLLDIGDRPFSLAFCGHTHGGQIALPGGMPLCVPKGALCRRYACGRFTLGRGRTLIVSRGVGCSAIPFRLFSPAEIVICDLVCARRPTRKALWERETTFNSEEMIGNSVGATG